MKARARKNEQLSFWERVKRSYGSTGNREAKQEQQHNANDLAENRGLTHGLACPRTQRGHAPSCTGTCPSSVHRRAPDLLLACFGGSRGRASELCGVVPQISEACLR